MKMEPLEVMLTMLIIFDNALVARRRQRSAARDVEQRGEWDVHLHAAGQLFRQRPISVSGPG